MKLRCLFDDFVFLYLYLNIYTDFTLASAWVNQIYPNSTAIRFHLFRRVDANLFRCGSNSLRVHFKRVSGWDMNSTCRVCVDPIFKQKSRISFQTNKQKIYLGTLSSTHATIIDILKIHFGKKKK